MTSRKNWCIFTSFICLFFLGMLYGFVSVTFPSKSFASNYVGLHEIKKDFDHDGNVDLIGDTVTVSGISNIATGLLHENYMQVFIQNDSTGLSLFSESFDKPIAVGDSIVATGIVQEYFGLVEINVLDYNVYYPGSRSEPASLPLHKIITNPGRYEGMLVNGQGTVIGKGTRYNGKYLLVSQADTTEKSIMVYVTNFHSMYADFDFESISVGDKLSIAGVLTQYNPDSKDGEKLTYKIHLRTPADLSFVGISKYQVLVWGSIGLAVFSIVIGWVVSLRSRVKDKTKEIKQSLDEKEILLKEIHHRVKNNLAIVSGLFELQMDGTQSKETEKVLRNSQSRLQSMALVHDKLYQTSSLRKIDMSQYIPELLISLHGSFNSSNKNIELSTDIDAVSLDIDRAIPCGLLINEIVVNVFKHAFKEKKSGLITVTMKKQNGNAKLVIADNGKGIPEDFDIRRSTSLGMMLIETFKAQLGSTLEIDSRSGTRFTFIFPVE